MEEIEVEEEEPDIFPHAPLILDVLGAGGGRCSQTHAYF
jgi:hypothetical protein